MYRTKDPDERYLPGFDLPFSGRLNQKNRWVRLYALIPWKELEEKYAALFRKKKGAPAKSVQMALGALIIQAKCSFTDRETVQQIRENPYMQFFIGLQEFIDEDPFDPSMMVFFRKRLNAQMVGEINDLVSLEPSEDETEGEQATGSDEESKENEGTLIVDATCAPADIRFPTDVNLLNEAREKLEKIIDRLFEPLVGQEIKPRTYREKGRQDFLRFVKKRKPTSKSVRKAIGKQLRYVKRNISTINKLAVRVGLKSLSKQEHRNLLVISELYRQQDEMYQNHKRSTEGRIVSITQPHIRPIVRGKASAQTEFGAKLSLSVVGGFGFLDKISWENYNEGVELRHQVEEFKRRFRRYPKAVVADKIYRNRDNLAYCKERGIRLSGPMLGRSPVLDEAERRRRKLIERMDNSIRNQIEGKFGEGKRAYGLGRVMTKLQSTSESCIALMIVVMNLEKKLRLLLHLLFFRLTIVFRVAPSST